MPRLAVWFFFVAAGLVAQDSLPIASRAPVDAQYEVLTNTPRGTLMLDRFQGKVYRLVDNGTARAQQYVWQEMEVEDAPPPAFPVPRFQISYTRNFPDSFLLLDTATGFTWRLSSQGSALVWLRLPALR